MALPPDRQLLVFPNPYHSVDHFGYPNGVVLFEPDPGGFSNVSHRGWVGARVDQERSVVYERRGAGDLRNTREYTAYAFETSEPTPVALTPYYLERIREGSLIAANERSARAAGVAFRAPQEALRAARDARRDEWKTRTGEDLPSLSADAEGHAQ